METLCHDMLSKNVALYLKHEQMLEVEKKERQSIADSFQAKMKVITDEIEAERDDRRGLLNKNQTLRDEIQEEINEYRKKESEFQQRYTKH